MHKAFLQLWEQFDEDVIQDGCSIHLSNTDRSDFIKSVYQKSPNEKRKISRFIGDSIEANISQTIYEKLTEQKNLRISQCELNNLIIFEDIIIEN